MDKRKGNLSAIPTRGSEFTDIFIFPFHVLSAGIKNEKANKTFAFIIPVSIQKAGINQQIHSNLGQTILLPFVIFRSLISIAEYTVTFF